MNLLRIVRWRWLGRGVLTLAILVGTVAGGLALWGVPAPPAIKTEDAPRVSWRWVWHSMAFVRKAQEARRFAGWLPGRTGLLVHVGTPGAIHTVEEPRAAPLRVPGLPDRARHVVQSRFTERPYFVYSVDEGGSERYLHYLYDLERETSHALTSEPARSHVGGFDREGRRMLYASASRNQRDMDLYIVDVTNPESHTRLFDADGQFSGILSPDGRDVLVTRSISHSSVLVSLLDLDDRSMRPLFGSETAVGLFDAAWSRDGRTLYIAADLDGEFAGIYAVDPRTGTRRLLTPALEWDVEDLELMSDNRTLAVLVNVNARRSLHLLDVPSQQLTRADGQPAGDVTRIVAHPSARTIALDVTAPAGVPGVWVYDLDAGRATPWAASTDDAAGLAAAHDIWYPTFDAGEDGVRRVVPAWVFPAAPEFRGRRPVVIDIHGGPAMQAGPVPRPHYEIIRGLGATIIAPNVRGSSGYGRTYLALDDRERREDAVRDIGALLDWIASQPDMDSTRVAVTGGSYGGYMVLASLVHYSNRIRCGFELFGISDFATFLQASEEGHFPDAQRAEFGDERDPVTRRFLDGISPAKRAERIRAPLLIFQGANDIRVKPQESRQMVERIRSAGGTVTYLEAANEGHGLEQPLNQLYSGAVAFEFLDRCLR